ncbi:unnamed protein product [Caenorhabditis nigoni]
MPKKRAARRPRKTGPPKPPKGVSRAKSSGPSISVDSSREVVWFQVVEEAAERIAEKVKKNLPEEVKVL